MVKLNEAIQFGFEITRCCWSNLGTVEHNMNQFPVDEQFNCSVGCESANQCEYYNNLPPTQLIPQRQNYAEIESSNFYYNNNFDDGVVPSNHCENNGPQMPCYQNYPNPIQGTAYFDQSANQNAGFSGGNYFIDAAQTYPPCQGPQPWNFAQCYGYYGEAPCQYADVVDMEDFM